MLTKLFRPILLILLLLTPCLVVHSQDLSQKLPVDPKVKTGKLSNGLSYYIRQNKKPENKAELRLVVNAGSILEDPDQQGLAHFTEHMAFNGSNHFKKNELVSFLQNMGIEFGADLNATTGFDETIYILPLPLNDPGNLEKGLTVLQDWAGGLSLDSLPIDEERKIILEESRLGKGADDRMFRKVFPLEYEGSRYAERLPIGKDSIIKSFKHAAIKRFYHEWYRPNLMAVIIVGDIDPAKTELLVKKYFSGLKNPAKYPQRFSSNVPPRKKNDAIVVTDKEATNFVVQVNYPILPVKPQITLGDYRHDMVKGLFTTILNERLSELTRSADPPFLYAGTGFNSYARGYEGFTAFTVAGKQGPDTALAAVMKEIERVKKFGFTQNELERAKKQFLSGFERIYNNRNETPSSSFADEYIRNFLTGEPIPGIANEYKYYQEFLPGIRTEEVDAFIKSLQNDKIFISLQGPSETDYKLPDAQTLLAIAENALKAPVQPYEEKMVASELMKTPPKPGTIVSEKKNEQLGTTEILFSNGLKAILKPTDFKKDEIIMSAFHLGGISKYPAQDKASATYAASVVQQMGISDFSPTDLTKMLAGKSVSVSPQITGLTAGLKGSCGVKDIETLLQLANLYITAPRKDEALFLAWKAKQKSAMQYAMADPQNVFVDSFYQTVYQRNPLAPIIIPSPETFDRVNLDTALSVYKDQFDDAHDFNFIFVGSFDVEKLKPLLALYLGSLPATGKPASFIDNGVRPVKGKLELTVKKGSEPKSLILMLFSGEKPYSEDLSFKAQALSETINIRITEDLREKMGAIYGGGIYGSASKFPYPHYSFILQLPCGPENVDTLIAAARNEIEMVKKNGPEQKDLDKVKKTWIEQYKVHLKENGFWNAQLQNIYYEQADPQRIFDYIKLVNDLTVDQLKAAANELFDGKNIVQAVLNPE